MIKYCKNCKKKTEHTPHGFEYYNRRYRCGECEREEWDGKGEMDAKLE